MATRVLRAPLIDAKPSHVNRPRLLEATLLVAGASTGFLLATDAAVAWQVVFTLAGLAAAWLLALALRRTGPRWAGWLLTLVGLVAVALAVGFAPYLVKPGPYPVKVATAVLLVAGLLLVGGGLVRATAGVKIWRRVLAGFAVLVALLLTVSVVSPAVAATHVPRPAIGASPSSVGLGYGTSGSRRLTT